MSRSALVVAPTVPEHDRSSGAKRLFDLVDFLREAGWKVTFVAEREAVEPRYVRDLTQRGIETHPVLPANLEAVVAESKPDLALLAFWFTADRHLALIRHASPTTRVIVDSVDLHFLRESRRAFVEAPPGTVGGGLERSFGEEVVGELNAYAAADGVLTVSEREARLLDDLLGRVGSTFVVPDSDDVPVSSIPFAKRSGILFVGNFNHTPNIDAVRYLLAEVIPLLDSRLLQEHPLSVVGPALHGRLGKKLGPLPPEVRFIDWVPSLVPYLHRSRATVVPLTYGAGTKRKLLQALLAGTPTVSTSVGVEGLELRDREHVLVADDPLAFAERLEEVLIDEALWNGLAIRGREKAVESHGRERARGLFMSAIEAVLARERTERSTTVSEATAYRRQRARVRTLLEQTVPIGTTVLVVSRGDPALVELDGPVGRHFPCDADGTYQGFHPSTSDDAIAALETFRENGAGYIAFPHTSAWWLDHYEGFREHLDTSHRRLWCDEDCVVYEFTAAGHPAAAPSTSVVIASWNRADQLKTCLDGFRHVEAPPGGFEIVVVDDGSTDSTCHVCAELVSTLPLHYIRTEHAGRAAAKNAGVLAAKAEIVLFLDDDELADPRLLLEHFETHRANPHPVSAVLGRMSWAPGVRVTPVMHFVTDVDRLLLAYGGLEHGQELDFRYFWEGQISCERAFLLEQGLHDERLEYTIDIELAYRLSKAGLRIVYNENARSYLTGEITFDDFCRRCEAKGRAQVVFSRLHPQEESVQRYCELTGAEETWARAQQTLEADRRRVAELEQRSHASANGSCPDDAVSELHELYRRLFRSFIAKGYIDELERTGRPDAQSGLLSVIVPLWNSTPQLAEMTRRYLERLWEIHQCEIEVIAIDNASAHSASYPVTTLVEWVENRGIAPAWNAGVDLARGEVLCFINSDVWVEPGWDLALLNAARDGERIVFPYTDHGDGLGHQRPDQAGTAGWCFALSRRVWERVGRFDESFSPAFGEDTDYFHRAWQLGVELNPVPAARVFHQRRSSASHHTRLDWLMQAHRLKFGWKHDVDPTAPPPFFNREIVDYVGAETEVPA